MFDTFLYRFNVIDLLGDKGIITLVTFNYRSYIKMKKQHPVS